MIKKSLSFFLQILNVCLLNIQNFKLSFLSKGVYFWVQVWISLSAITCIQNWLIGPQRAGSREKWHYLFFITSKVVQELNLRPLACKQAHLYGLSNKYSGARDASVCQHRQPKLAKHVRRDCQSFRSLCNLHLRKQEHPKTDFKSSKKQIKKQN